MDDALIIAALLNAEPPSAIRTDGTGSRLGAPGGGCESCEGGNGWRLVYLLGTGVKFGGIGAGLGAGARGAGGGGGKVVIGENMTRVREYAGRIGGETFEGVGMARNREWIRAAIADGKEVIDIGPDFPRRLDRHLQGLRPDSPFYNMERAEAGESAMRAFDRSGRFEGGVPGLDF